MTNDQARLLRRKMNNTHLPRGKGQTIAFTSGKGGVGKSNIAINFAIQLAKMNYKVLIVDLDVGMGNVDVLLGVRAKHSIVDALENDRSFEQIVQKGPAQIDYIAGGSSFTKLFMINAKHEHFFLSEFAILVQKYDYLLFDIGAGLTEESLFFIRASDEVIVVTTPEPTALTDGYSIVKHLTANAQTLPIHIVMNRSFSSKSGNRVLDQFSRLIESFLHVSISKLAIIPDDALVREAVMHQVPFSIKYKRCPASRAIEQMAIRFITNSQIEPQEKPFSFIHKIKQLLGEKK